MRKVYIFLKTILYCNFSIQFPSFFHNPIFLQEQTIKISKLDSKKTGKLVSTARGATPSVAID